MSTDPSLEPTDAVNGADPEAPAADADPEHLPRPAPAPVPEAGLHDLTVEISDTQNHLAVDREALARLVRATLAAEGIGRADICLAIVDDATIRAINHRYLDHDWPTDVISFGLSDPDDETLAGEIVISAEMAATTAHEAGVAAQDELALYVVHGLLHLCGHDDATDPARLVMRRREGEVLAAAGLTNTFPAAGPLGGDDDRSRPGYSTPTGTTPGRGVREAPPWSV